MPHLIDRRLGETRCRTCPDSFPIYHRSVIMLGLLYVAVGFALKQTTWGRHVYAVGDDAEAARLAGISGQPGAVQRLRRWPASSTPSARWILIGLNAGAPVPNAARGRQPRVDHGGGHRRDQPVRWTRRPARHPPGALIFGSFRTGLSLAGVDDQWRVLDHRGVRDPRGLGRPVDQEGDAHEHDSPQPGVLASPCRDPRALGPRAGEDLRPGRWPRRGRPRPLPRRGARHHRRQRRRQVHADQGRRPGGDPGRR